MDTFDAYMYSYGISLIMILPGVDATSYLNT